MGIDDVVPSLYLLLFATENGNGSVYSRVNCKVRLLGYNFINLYTVYYDFRLASVRTWALGPYIFAN